MPILLFIKKTYLVFISLLGFIFLFAACQDEWDLPEVSFPEIITLEKLEMNGPPTEMIVYGEIKGLKDAESSVDEHGHILKLAGNGGSLDLEGNYEKRVQRQRKGNGTYTSLIAGLTPDSIYIYRAYAIFNGKVYYGEIRGFMAGSVGSMLEVTNVEILIKSPTASAIRVDCQIEGLPEKMEITDYGIALVRLSTPEDTTIPDLITGNIYSLGAIPKTEPTAVFSIPVSPLLPG